MSTNFNAVASAVLDGVVASNPRVPGVVAMVTDRHRNIYDGAAGFVFAAQRIHGDDTTVPVLAKV